VASRLLDMLLRRGEPAPTTPSCPDHKVEMRLRGKMGRPARFSDTTEEEYTLIYFCPVPGCNHTAERKNARSQIPVPGEPPARPSFARRRR